MTTTWTFQPTPETALDLTVDGNDVELTTREVDAYGIVVTLPLPVLRATLAALAALAAHQDQPDVDMDDGVIAAAIETETGSYTRTDEPVCCGPLDEDVKFWHDRWHEAADRRDSRDAMAALWKETVRRLSKERDAYRSDARFEEARANRLATAYKDAASRREEAKQERDIASGKYAEQPRGFTVEGVDDAAVAKLIAFMWAEFEIALDHPEAREALTAAFTSEPQRPAGAEKFDPIVDAAIRGHSDITSSTVVHAISDALAEEGVLAPEVEA